MERCDGCGRRKAGDRRLHRWVDWTMRRPKWWGKLTTPWWWRFGVMCLCWYDCPGEYPPEMRITSRLCRFWMQGGEVTDRKEGE